MAAKGGLTGFVAGRNGGPFDDLKADTSLSSKKRPKSQSGHKKGTNDRQQSSRRSSRNKNTLEGTEPDSTVTSLDDNHSRSKSRGREDRGRPQTLKADPDTAADHQNGFDDGNQSQKHPKVVMQEWMQQAPNVTSLNSHYMPGDSYPSETSGNPSRIDANDVPAAQYHARPYLTPVDDGPNLIQRPRTGGSDIERDVTKNFSFGQPAQKPFSNLHALAAPRPENQVSQMPKQGGGTSGLKQQGRTKLGMKQSQQPQHGISEATPNMVETRQSQHDHDQQSFKQPLPLAGQQSQRVPVQNHMFSQQPQHLQVQQPKVNQNQPHSPQAQISQNTRQDGSPSRSSSQHGDTMEYDQQEQDEMQYEEQDEMQDELQDETQDDMQDAVEHDQQETLLDYDQDQLFKFEYDKLKAESFDNHPRGARFNQPPEFESRTLAEKLDAITNQNDQVQFDFFASIITSEWEAAGDWFLDRFGDLIKNFKSTRQQKREAAQGFEEEVEKRHDHVTRKRAATDGVLRDMKTSGSSVLTPKKKR